MEGSENQTIESSKDKLSGRLREKYPDMDPANEDALYQRIVDDYDEYDQRINASRDNEKSLVDLFSSDPRSASFLMSWRGGENPVIALVRQYGDQIREALDDPEMQEQLVAARTEYMDKQSKNQELQEQSRANLDASMNNLDAAMAEGGYSEEDADNAFGLFIDIVEKGIMNDVSKETWLMFLKALNHDKDVEAAAYEAEVRGRNAKIDKEKEKKTVPELLPPSLNGSREIQQEQATKSMGALDRYTESGDIWSRGKRN